MTRLAAAGSVADVSVVAGGFEVPPLHALTISTRADMTASPKTGRIECFMIPSYIFGFVYLENYLRTRQ